jgi:hypothetical protein
MCKSCDLQDALRHPHSRFVALADPEVRKWLVKYTASKAVDPRGT